jgi:ribosomal protein S18 acetylase RimI-like enzyme
MALGWERRAAMGADEVDLGFASVLVTADLPLVFDQNVVWVRQAAEPALVRGAVEDLAEQAGWQHRTIEVTDERIAERLRPGLVAAGYVESHNVTMVLGDDHPAPPDGSDATVVEIGQQQELARRLLTEEPWATNDAVLDQFAERERRLAGVADGQAVVAPPTEPVSRALLLRDGGFFEIDSVMTLSERQGEGWSTAVMGRALRVGVESGRPVVLVADEQGWPIGWYERLGFRRAGVLTLFRRWPVDG